MKKFKIKKKSIVMIGGGIQQVLAVKKLQDEGFQVIVSDMDSNADAAKIADFHICTSAKNVKDISTWILQNKRELNIKGIFTLIHFAYEVSLIAKTCKLPTLEPNIILKADDKLLCKKMLEANNLPIAKYFEINSIEDLKEKLKIIGYPAILKNTDSFGGKGTLKILNEKEVTKKWRTITEFTSSGSVILEEILKGDFIDLQGFMYEQKFSRAGTSSVWFTEKLEGVNNTNPIETHHISPSIQPKKIIDDAFELFEKACIATKLTWGPVGIDLIKTKEGLKIIEISPRLHGPNGSLRILPYSTGIEPIKFLGQLVSNEKPDKSFLNQKFMKFSTCWVHAGKPGIVKKIKIPKSPDIIDHLIYAKIGKAYNIKPPFAGSLAVFSVSKSKKRAIELMEFLDKNIKYEITT